MQDKTICYSIVACALIIIIIIINANIFTVIDISFTRLFNDI